MLIEIGSTFMAAHSSHSSDRKIIVVSVAIFISLLMWMWLSPRGSFFLVVAQPFASEQTVLSIIGRADGNYVAGGSLPWIAIAQSDAPSFPAQLRRAGALLVLNANLKSICSQEIF
ncbi:hypothetical protein N7E02_08905 [Aliirhizobium terrae]|uniref:hypothetical protein n=1 Tax=Terrirhizobium terrae TaxID=2926709 RepID=UPI0025792387|nr:hypothetical protein [Rhizobium sp. CC-CFT758]WJH40705.1 hypothetical protein N7E02_08905 [Rhizobium sp. CC-CFT758]